MASMETTIDTRTFTLQVPKSDVHFLSVLAKKMGWKKKEHPNNKNGLDIALEDMEQGNLKSFDSVATLMNYLNS